MFSLWRNLLCGLLIQLSLLDISKTISTNRTIKCSIIKKDSLIFDCSARWLKEVPSPTHYSSDSVELLLSQNLIDVINKNSFQVWKNLTKIDLNSNHYSKKRLSTSNVCQRGLEIDKETFTNLTKLQQLFIDYNYLCEIPSGLPHGIANLSFQFNFITSINKTSLSRFRHLKELYLGHNCYYGNQCSGVLDIENGTFSDLKELIVLSLSFNNLTSVPPHLPSSLQKLYLSNNKIKVIYRGDFKNLVNLEVLYLSGNCPRCLNVPYPCKACPGNGYLQIDDLAFQSLKNLTVLHLSSTSLTTVSKTWFQNMSRLKILNLKLNYLLSEIATGDFLSYLPSLEILDLSYNYNASLYPYTINISDNFSKLTSLRELYIQGYFFQHITNKSLEPLTKLRKLNLINLSINFIFQVDLEVFQNFPSGAIIYLSDNWITPLQLSTNKIQEPGEFYNSLPTEIHSKSTYNDVEHSTELPGRTTKTNALVKQQCSAKGKTLDLSLNNIFFIETRVFPKFPDIRCLNLSFNGLGRDLNGTEFENFPNLKYLDLSFNKLDFAFGNAFQELKYLEVLDVSYNNHYFIKQGLAHSLTFTQHLQKLAVLNLSWNAISTLAEFQIVSSSLSELRFAGNHLDVLWGDSEQRYKNLFHNLTNVSILDISYNRLQSILDNATNYQLPKQLTELYLHNNRLVFFGWKLLSRFKSLKILDLSYNRLTMITAHLGNCTKSLQTLIISHNYIQTLTDAFLFKLSTLTNLDLSYNHIQNINKSIFLSGNENYLKVLGLKGNPFDCTCEIVDFINWINGNNVSIPRLATDVTCATPDKWKKNGIILFEIHACNMDFIALLLFLASLVIIVPLTMLPVMGHLFYWDIWFIYHWCKAGLKYRKFTHSETMYDAFITYDENDPAVSDWVFNELCYQLENRESKHILLCLEERDWEPGKAIIDNIAESINQSKKTLFVLTKNYVKRGKFRTAFYLALQKLMDENQDVIVIILLQPVLQHSQYLRLRKNICKSSILEWPKNPHAKNLFWQKIKNVLLTENISRYNNLYTDSIAIVR